MRLAEENGEEGGRESMRVTRYCTPAPVRSWRTVVAGTSQIIKKKNHENKTNKILISKVMKKGYSKE